MQSCLAIFATLLLCLASRSVLAQPSGTQPARVPRRAAPHDLVRRLPPVTNALPGVAARFPVQQASYEEADPALEPLALPTPESGEAGELDLTQLEELALSANPAVARALAEIEALEGKWVQVGLPPNPTIGYVGNEIGDLGAAGLQGAYVGQRVIAGHKLQRNRAIVAEEIARAERQLAVQQQRVLTDVQIGFYDVLIAQRRADLAAELVSVSEKAVQASRRLLDAQEIPRVALLQSEVETLNAKIVLRRAENETAAAWRRLSAVIGTRELMAQRLHGDLDQAISDLDWHGQLDRLLAESPEIAVAAAELERALAQLDRAYVEPRPDLNVQLSVQHGSVSNDTVANVQFGIALPLYDKNQGGIQQAYGEIAAARQNIQRVELNLVQRLATTFRQYANARFQVQTYTEQILPKADETFDLVSRGYRNGEVSYLDMLTAQRTFFQTNLAYIASLRELWTAALRMDGLLLENSLADN